jgi:4'-phosphopantetheinyl transferase
MRPDQVTIHLIDPSRVIDVAGYLTAEEKSRAAGFRFEADSRHWAACRTALRLVLAEACGTAPNEIPITLGANGKPVLGDPFSHLHFNLSHCRDLALVAMATEPVGIDLERSDRAMDLIGCETTFCHPNELEGLPADQEARAMSLLEIWTAKESVLKALGTGFLLPPEEISIELGEEAGRASSCHGLAHLSSLRIHRLRHSALYDHTAFMAAPASIGKISFRTDLI